MVNTGIAEATSMAVVNDRYRIQHTSRSAYSFAKFALIHEQIKNGVHNLRLVHDLAVNPTPSEVHNVGEPQLARLMINFTKESDPVNADPRYRNLGILKGFHACTECLGGCITNRNVCG